jgi:two-component system sensor histidine kinase YesM
MILQPLVENAVIHGAEPLTRPVEVRARAFRKDGRLVLEVADNGLGMPEEVAEAIRSGEFNGDGQSLGLQSVLQRLQAEFGDHLLVEATSQPDEGTCIRLVLPLHNYHAEQPAVPSRHEMPLAHGLGNQIDLNDVRIRKAAPDSMIILE